MPENPISSGQTKPPGAPSVDVPGATSPILPNPQMPEGYKSTPSWPRPKGPKATSLPKPTA